MEGMNRHSVGQHALCALVALIAIAGGLFVGAGPGRAHSGDVIDSAWATTPPTADGVMTAGEWAGATSVDLGAIPGNELPSSLLVMNDDAFLWVAYDAVGDTTASSQDAASFALDTGHDGVETDGAEDEFFLGSYTAHYVWRSGSYGVDDSPFNTSLPDHAGLAGARGFGPSDANSTDHRIFEFQVPLALIGAGAGDTVGFFGGSQPAAGVLDYDSYFYSTWPEYVMGPIPPTSYGDLNLGYLPGPIDVRLSPSSAAATAAPGETVWYNLTARNIGTAVSDTFDITATGVWSATLWQAAGPVALLDTDGDTVPDTGNLTSGSSATFVVKVDVPPSAAGCDVTTITARSSWDVSILDTSSLTTCVGPAVFSPPHSDRGVDTNGNSLFDYLDVSVSISVGTMDLYWLVGELYDPSGATLIDTASSSFYGNIGPNIIDLSFYGLTIYASGFDGPYRADLYLYDYSGNLLDTDTYLTNPYLVTEFEMPAAHLRPPYSDRGVDTDVPANGLFDELELTVGVTVNIAGSYYLWTQVEDSTYSYVTAQDDQFTLPTGDQTVTIVYPGDLFYRANGNGPYTISIGLYDQYGYYLDQDMYATGAYLKTDFDPPAIVFAPPHHDRGEDTDTPPDGLFDWLVVSASLSVAEAGDYTVAGALFSPYGYYLGSTTAQATLVVGPATVDLRFPGLVIYQDGASGYYRVEMYVWRSGVNMTLDYDNYYTGYYSWSQFQPPPARFASTHDDHGVDISDPPDGLFDWLEVDAGVVVTDPGRYTVTGVLYGAFGILGSTTGTVDVSTPQQVSVPLDFDGHAIGRDLAGGPYEVFMVLYDSNSVELDYTYYFTHMYASSEFQPIDGTRPSSVASVGGGFWKNGPFTVSYAATDPSPSDGLQSVQLSYRHSADNATWSGWSVFDADAIMAAGDAQASGSFLFDLPAGDGYYQFRTLATDRAGNVEAVSASADAVTAAFVPAILDLTPATDTITAGATRAFQVTVRTAAGSPARMASPLTVTLVADSAGGEFRATGTSTAITSITIAAGQSQATFDYVDTLAGTSTVTVACAKAAPDSAALTVGPGAAVSIEITPAVGGVAVGSSVTLAATVRDTYGNVVPGSTVTWAIEGPGSLSSTSGASISMTASGAGAIRVTATAGSASGSLSVTAYGAGGTGGGDLGAPTNLAVGLGGGLAIGLVVGIGMGWLVGRRRKKALGTAPPSAPPPGGSA